MGGSKITVTDRIAYKIHTDRKSAVLYDYLDSVHCFMSGKYRQQIVHECGFPYKVGCG